MNQMRCEVKYSVKWLELVGKCEKFYENVPFIDEYKQHPIRPFLQRNSKLNWGNELVASQNQLSVSQMRAARPNAYSMLTIRQFMAGELGRGGGIDKTIRTQYFGT